MKNPFRNLFRRAEPCGHAALIFDIYKDTKLATCPYCGETWISADPDWSAVTAGHGLGGDEAEG